MASAVCNVTALLALFIFHMCNACPTLFHRVMRSTHFCIRKPLHMDTLARFHELRPRLTDPTLTVDEYREFCTLNATTAIKQGLLAPDPHWFVTDDMLLSYWKAVDWWPTYLPAHPCPTLEELSFQYPHLPGKPAYTFAELLSARAAQVIPLLEADKRSVVNPNETAEERKLRLNRERVRRSRQRSKAEQAGGAGSDAGAQADTAAEQQEPPAAAALREQIAALKAQRASDKEAADAWVAEAWREMRSRGVKRNAHLAELDARILQLEEQLTPLVG